MTQSLTFLFRKHMGSACGYKAQVGRTAETRLTHSLPPGWQKLVYRLQGKGLQVIVAHPERYRPIQKDIDIAYEMKDLGCYLQLSGNFAVGGFSSPVRKTAIELLCQEMVDYVASDAHCPEDYDDYIKALSIARKCERQSASPRTR